MSSLQKLKDASSLGDLAKILGYKPKALSYIVYIIPDTAKYVDFCIPKKNGGVRKINAPIEQLKKVQSHLSEHLTKCFDEINKNNKHIGSLSHGFRKKHSIITNASKHTKMRYVFNIDLKDFFPSINFGRVRGFFIKNNHFGLDPKIATLIAKIACHNNCLPQGSPCSPIISNLIGHLLDIRMANLAKKAKCTYSRYVDDLTFSTNKKDFPERISIPKTPDGNEWLPSLKLIKEVKSVGFSINENKTSLQHKTSRQIATGLVVNQKVNIKREYYKRARSMCFSLFQTDEFRIADKPGSMKQLEGILSYVYHIKKAYDVSKNGDKLHKPKGVLKLYREFLFYKNFFTLDKPVIICEGKTDVVYLKCALKQLENKFGGLVKKNDKKYSFLVNFLDLTKNIRDVFSIAEGSSGLLSLIDIYKNHMAPFKGQGRKHPVIILADNDSGAKQIKKKYIKDTSKPFYNLGLNLYIVFTPLNKSGDETSIEDFFTKKTLSTKLEGKTFSRKAKIDPKKEYGKSVFASKVISINQNTINFNRFKYILNQFEAIKEDYNKKISKSLASE